MALTLVKGNTIEENIQSINNILESFNRKVPSVVTLKKENKTISDFGVFTSKEPLYLLGVAFPNGCTILNIFFFALPMKEDTKVQAEVFMLDEKGNGHSIILTLLQKTAFQYPNNITLPAKSLIYAKITQVEGEVLPETKVWLSIERS